MGPSRGVLAPVQNQSPLAPEDVSAMNDLAQIAMDETALPWRWLSVKCRIDLYQPAETLTHARMLRVRASLPYPIGPPDVFAMVSRWWRGHLSQGLRVLVLKAPSAVQSRCGP